jgi:hypothetical protein
VQHTSCICSKNISGSNVTHGAGGVGGQIDLSADGSNAINNTGNGGGRYMRKL